MNSRERVLAAINHEKLDRVPTDIWATPEVWAKLREHFRVNTDIMTSRKRDASTLTGWAASGRNTSGRRSQRCPRGRPWTSGGCVIGP